nr:unnamed protein product [Callosobruchus analis]
MQGGVIFKRQQLSLAQHFGYLELFQYMDKERAAEKIKYQSPFITFCTVKMAPPNKILRRKIGGRPYIPYSINAMEQCLRDVRNHVLTQREASKKHLEIEIKDVDPESIYNYDETNLVDDPGKKKIITKRGCKYPEAIKNSTKAAVSIMVCGNAAEELLPPPFKCYWRQILDTWKSTPDGQRLPTIPKNVFPSLLNKLLVKILGNAESNVKSGFMKTGIYPLCAEKMLERFPTYSRPEVDNPNPMLVSDVFIEYIKNVRKEAVGENVPKRRNRKLQLHANNGDLFRVRFYKTLIMSELLGFLKALKSSRGARMVLNTLDNKDLENGYGRGDDGKPSCSYIKTIDGMKINDHETCYDTTGSGSAALIGQNTLEHESNEFLEE